MTRDGFVGMNLERFKYDADREAETPAVPSWVADTARFRLRLDIRKKNEVSSKKLYPKAVHVIGSRLSISHVLINHPSISPAHVMIVQHKSENESTCILFDLNSRGGTFVGKLKFGTFVGRRLKPFQPFVLSEKSAFKMGSMPDVYVASGMNTPIVGVKLDRHLPSINLQNFRIGPTKGRMGSSTWSSRHMHSWHLRNVGASAYTEKQFEKVYRAQKHPKYEMLLRGLEVVSCFTFDVNHVLLVIENLQSDRTTRTTAKRDLNAMIETAFLAGNKICTGALEANDDRAESAGKIEVVITSGAQNAFKQKWLKLPTIGAFRRYKIFQNLKTVGEVKSALHQVVNVLVEKEWKPKDVDANAVGVQVRWNTIHGDPALSQQSHCRTGNTLSEPSVASSLSQPRSFLLRDQDPHLLTNEFAEAVRPPEEVHIISLSKAEAKTGRWEQRLQDLPESTDAMDMTSSAGLAYNIATLPIIKFMHRQFKKLKYLDISSCGLRPKNLSALAKHINEIKKLSVLRLANNHIVRGEKINPSDPTVNGYHYDSSGILQFFLAMGKNTSVRALDLRRNNLKEQGAKLFVTATKNNKTLTELDMSSNNIKNKGVIQLDVLTRGPNSVMANLFLGRNHIEMAGLHVLFQPPAPIPATRDLYERRSLRHISLRGNAGMDSNALAILNTNLRYGWNSLVAVDFSWCPLGSKGATQLLFLLRNRCIKTLSVSHCNLTDQMTNFDPMVKFSQWLAKNHTMRELDISYNGLVGRKLGYKNDNECVIEALISSLKTNLALTKIDVRGNAIGNSIRLRMEYVSRKNLKLPIPERTAFWMCTQPRLGKKSPAKILHRGLLLNILSFCIEKRVLIC